ncbi:MAG: (2Fe-2S)-binding protein, partial [Anaerolineae bacterium]
MKTYQITLHVNGDPFTLNVSPRRTLLDVLRWDLDLRGTHRGCDTGDCGLCTVLLAPPGGDGPGRSVVSCLVLAVDADGCSITTVEGLRHPAGDGLHPVQETFVKTGAIQCGYCTSGMIMSAVALLESNPQPTEAEARAAIAGNLCRCTGYTKIVEAIVEAG